MSPCYGRQQYPTMLAAEADSCVPTSPQAERGTEGPVGGLTCKASRTWTLWNAAIG